MNKPLLLLLSLITTAISSFAQITVTSSDIATAGTTIYTFYDSVATPTGLTITAGSSTAQTWDYSALQYDLFDSIEFVTPASTGYASNFPSSNLALEQDDFISFLNLSSGGLSIEGIYGDISGQNFPLAVSINPTLSVINFPANYGDALMDTAVIDSTVSGAAFGISTVDSARFIRKMIVNSEIDAYGSLTTPSGTYDVLRVYTMQVNIDTLNVLFFGSWQTFQTTIDTSYTYQFIANGEDYFVLDVTTDTPNGNIIESSYKEGYTLAAVVNTTDALCYGSADGEATVNAIGGSGTYTYSFSAGSSSGNTVTGLSAGTYSVVVNDGSSTATVSFTINEPDSISITTSINTQPTPGNSDGEVEASATGGTPGYAFVWSDNSGVISTNPTLNNIPAGTYTVTVTDVNGCSTSETLNLTTNGINDAEVNASLLVYPNPSNGVVHVSNTTTIERITVFDITGSTVVDLNIHQKKTVLDLDVEHGIYLMRIQTPEGISTHRLVKTN